MTVNVLMMFKNVQLDQFVLILLQSFVPIINVYKIFNNVKKLLAVQRIYHIDVELEFVEHNNQIVQL
jgi:hypothetical protein